MKSFQETQLAFVKHLRAPDFYPAPKEMEDRRMGIYRELIYNNIESFIATVFPVVRSLLSDAHWHKIVRAFIQEHECQTPYFLQISAEFLQYLLQERGLEAGDPEYLLELAHYEWVELALDVSELEIPAKTSLPLDLFASHPRVSPLAMTLNYSYPVHKISPQHRYLAAEPSQLVVYRNRVDQVKFLAANPVTARLLYLLQIRQDLSLDQNIAIIGAELHHPQPDLLIVDAEKLVRELYELEIISHFD